MVKNQLACSSAWNGAQSEVNQERRGLNSQRNTAPFDLQSCTYTHSFIISIRFLYLLKPRHNVIAYCFMPSQVLNQCLMFDDVVFLWCLGNLGSDMYKLRNNWWSGVTGLVHLGDSAREKRCLSSCLQVRDSWNMWRFVPDFMVSF